MEDFKPEQPSDSTLALKNFVEEIKNMNWVNGSEGEIIRTTDAVHSIKATYQRLREKIRRGEDLYESDLQGITQAGGMREKFKELFEADEGVQFLSNPEE